MRPLRCGWSERVIFFSFTNSQSALHNGSILCGGTSCSRKPSVLMDTVVPVVVLRLTLYCAHVLVCDLPPTVPRVTVLVNSGMRLSFFARPVVMRVTVLPVSIRISAVVCSFVSGLITVAFAVQSRTVDSGVVTEAT